MSELGLPPLVRAWQERGRFIRVAGIEVFVVDAGEGAGARAAEANVVLHGFPSSSSDWRLVLPRLAAVRRTVLLARPASGGAALVGADQRERAHRARAPPVAVIAIAEKLAAEIPGAQHRRLEGIGHYPMIEAPEATATALTELLGRL